MEQEKICFVSMPFGRKADPITGRLFDFDHVYRHLVQPAATDAGYTAIRADEFGGQVILRPLIEQVITSDLFIADVTTANPNVMYELGLRHALSSGATLLVMGSGTPLPFDVSLARVIPYNVDDSGNLIEEDTVRRYLAEAIRQGVGRAGSDSPVYAFFPELRVEMPSELARGGRKPRTITKQTVQAGTLPPGLPSSASLKQAEEQIRTSKDTDPASVLELLKGYQVNSAWKDLVHFATELPQTLRDMPQVQQMAALALNRLGRQDEAVAMIRSLIARTGGDSDSYGILGRIYKDLYARDTNREHLEEAIRNYRSAFKMAPNDYYSGMNLVSLLVTYGGDEARNELNDLVPRLRSQFGQRVADPRADYLDFASAVELAVIARDWPAAYDLQQRMLRESRAEWMLQTTANGLHALGQFMGEADRIQLKRLVAALTERQTNA